MTSERHESPEQIEHEIAATRQDISATLDAIQYRLSPVRLLGNTFAAARGVAGDAAQGAKNMGGGIRDVGNDFASNLGRTIRENPLPVTLLGIGLGWLLLSSRRSGGNGRDWHEYETPATWRPPYGYGDPEATGAGETEGEGVSATVTHLGEDISDTAQEGYRMVEGRARQVKDTMAEIGAEVRARASGAAEHAGDMGRRAKESIGAGRESARDYAGRTGAAAREYKERAGAAAREYTARAGAAARDYSTRARHAASDAGRSAVRTAEEHPLLVATALFAAGAAVAALLPRTRKEDELLGEAGENLRQSARSAAGGIAREAKHAARAAADAAREAAEREGLTPADMQREASRLAGSAANVVQSAGEAARTRAERGDSGTGSASGGEHREEHHRARGTEGNGAERRH